MMAPMPATADPAPPPPTRRIRAAVCRAFGEPLAVEDVELRAPGAGEVGVRIRACGVCHSDLTHLRGAWGGELPAVYGHEAAGVVDEVGAGVDGLAAGDRVVVTLVRSCGACVLCRRGLPALCERMQSLPLSRDPPLRTADGRRIQQGLRTAAFAERVTVHASQAVPIPAGLAFESAALLGCGVLTGVGAVLTTAAAEPGSTVAVIGVGGVGLNAVQGAVLAGAGVILAVDVVESKLALARAFGATHVADGASGDAAVAALDATAGRGLDYVIVTAPSIRAVQQAMGLVAAGGSVVLVGMPPNAVASIDVETVADRGVRILGSKLGSARPHVDIPRLAGLYQERRLRLDELVSGRFALDDVNEAVAAATGGDAVRSVVVP
jgi:Zn-dependent alcohol dehydrogenase